MWQKMSAKKTNNCGFTQINNVAFTSATMANNISQQQPTGYNICQQHSLVVNKKVTITSVTKNNKKFGTNSATNDKYVKFWQNNHPKL